MEIAYVSFDSVRQGVGASQVVPMVRALSGLGHSMTLLSLEHETVSHEEIQALLDAGVNWSPIKRTRFGVRGAIAGVISAAKCLPADSVVHCRSDLPVLSAALRHRKFVWDSRSLWVDQRVASRQVQEASIEWRFARKLEAYSYRNSHGWLTLTHAAAKVLHERYGASRAPHQVVPTCVDLKRFAVAEMPALDELKLLILGPYGPSYDVPLTRRLVEKLRGSIDVRVTWATPRNISDADLGLGEELVHPEWHEIPKLITEHHAGLALLHGGHTPAMSGSSPTKLAEFWASGRPVIVSSGIGDTDHLVREFQSGLLVDSQHSHNNGDEASQLLSLCADNDLPRRCRQLSEKHFDLRHGAKSVDSLYRAIAQ